MVKRYNWTDEDREFVRNNAETMKDTDVAKGLSELKGMDVNVQSVRKLRQSLGIHKKRGRGVCAVKQEKNVGGTTADLPVAVVR